MHLHFKLSIRYTLQSRVRQRYNVLKYFYLKYTKFVYNKLGAQLVIKIIKLLIIIKRSHLLDKKSKIVKNRYWWIEDELNRPPLLLVC